MMWSVEVGIQRKMEGQKGREVVEEEESPAEEEVSEETKEIVTEE